MDGCGAAGAVALGSSVFGVASADWVGCLLSADEGAFADSCAVAAGGVDAAAGVGAVFGAGVLADWWDELGGGCCADDGCAGVGAAVDEAGLFGFSTGGGAVAAGVVSEDARVATSVPELPPTK